MTTVMLAITSAVVMAADDHGPTPNAERRTPNAAVVIDMSASPASLAVGERVTVTLTYRWPRGWTVTEPDPGPALRDAFVVDLPPAKKTATGDEERRVFTVVLAATRSGAWALPRPSFTVTGPDGAVTAQAPEVLVQVGVENKPAALPAVRNAWVRPPPSVVVTPWGVYGTVAGVVVAAAIAAWWWLRRRHVVLSGLTPLQIFTRELDAARMSGDGKEAGGRLSLALRRYVGALWRFDGPGSTTRETASFLRGRLPDEEFTALVRLLDRLDDLRWSPGAVPTAALERDLATGQEWATGVQQRLDAEEAARQAARKTGAAR
jgi:hypothetical protein